MKSDALIKHEVLCELKWDAHVEETAVVVEVDKGVVTLPNHLARTDHDIAQMVRRVLEWDVRAGVEMVKVDLQVAGDV